MSQKTLEIEELDRWSSVLRHFRFLWSVDPRMVWALIEETFAEWSKDNAPRLGAALAYYTIFSLAPLLVVVIGIAGVFLGQANVETHIVAQVQDLVGVQGAESVRVMLEGMRAPERGMVAAIVGLFTLFFGASLVVAELRNALNTVWEIPPAPDDRGLIAGIVIMIRRRFFSFALVLGVGFLLLISLVVNAWLAAVGKYFSDLLPVPEIVLQTANFILSFAVTTVLFALIYKILPDAEISWSDVAVGATVTSMLFTAGKLLIALYLGKSSIGSAYGAAGSLVILLAWVYYSAQIFFLGAEFTQVYANRYGSRLVARMIHAPATTTPVIAER